MDAYDLQARHAPFVFALFPAILVAIAMVPGLGQTKIVTGSIAFLVLAAIPLVGTRIARAAGRAREDALYAAWGGMPTTALLRYRDTRLNPQTKKIYRERLNRLGASFPIPEEDEERRDPEGADVKIGAAMDEIRRRAKEKGIKAIHRENINYGAARNAYGLKPFGLATCLISMAVLTINVAMRGGFSPTALELAVGMVILIIAGGMILGCTSDKVRHHGEAYALALFEAIETVVPRRPKRERSG
ncbi:MAG: hypothetical protein ACREOH_24270 [Candidatus Entotheonellia bacterium]